MNVAATEIVSAATRALEFPSRLIYALVKPAVKIARRFNLPLDVLSNLVEMAYIEELREVEGLNVNQIASTLGKSRRTVGYLVERFKRNFFEADEEIALLRTVEAEVLGGKSRLANIGETLSKKEKSRATAALETLCRTGRIRRERNGSSVRYLPSQQLCTWVTEDIDGRIDGLNHQMAAVSSAVVRRFVEDDAQNSVVRTYGFRAESEVIQQMITSLIKTIRLACIEAEEAALNAQQGEEYLLSFSLAPKSSGEKS